MFSQRLFSIFSIGLLLVASPFVGWAMDDRTVHTGVHHAETAEQAELRADLAKIDGTSNQGDLQSAAVLIGQNIKARDIYQDYLKTASVISSKLLEVKVRMAENQQTFSLQELGALTQGLSAENQRFRASFSHGEDRFQTYQLIEKAIFNLEDATEYWRVSNHYRAMARGSATARADDDAVLRVKLQTAISAIDELKAIIHTRDVLNKGLSDEH